MRRSTYSGPDAFSTSPLLALLPVVGQVSKLPALTTSLFARYEKVKAQLEEFSADRQTLRRYAVEEAMLKQVLDYLALSPEEEK